MKGSIYQIEKVRVCGLLDYIQDLVIDETIDKRIALNIISNLVDTDKEEATNELEKMVFSLMDFI